MRSLKVNNGIVWACLIGFVLRIWNFSEAQFHHDEISALLRTRFSSFSELIEKGVAIDGHPAFTQFFLWCYTAIVGIQPMWIKLPFLLAGVGSIYLLYRITEELFNQRSAMISAGFLAVMQFPITYSLWARPYAFGLCFVLAAFLFLIKFRKEGRVRNLLIYSFFAALAAYTHYFAMLQMLLVALTYFLFFVPRSKKLAVFIASLLAVSLWLPHYSLTMGHLNIGGIGAWLNPPASDFGLSLLAYIFHYSEAWIVTVFLSLVVFLFKIRSQDARIMGMRLWLLMMTLLPFVIAFYYSVEINPLLHHGTMLFALPFLLILIGSLFERFNQQTTIAFAVLFTMIGVSTLIEDRQHFTLNYETEFGDPFALKDSLVAAGESTVLLTDVRMDGLEMLLESNQITSENVYSISQIEARGSLATWLNSFEASNCLITATSSSDLAFLAEALEQYPCVVQVRGYNAAATYWLSKDCKSGVILDETNICSDPTRSGCGYPLTPKTEYSPGVSWKTGVHQDNANSLLVLRSFWVGSEQEKTTLVVDWNGDQGKSYWSGKALGNQYDSAQKLQRSYIVLDGRDLPGQGRNGSLKGFVWQNGAPEQVIVKAVDLRLFPSNALRYGLFEDF